MPTFNSHRSGECIGIPDWSAGPASSGGYAAEHPVPHPDRRYRLDPLLAPDDVAARGDVMGGVLPRFAAMNVAVCLPIHLWLSRRANAPTLPAAGAGPVPPIARQGTSYPRPFGPRGFLLMVVTFALESLVVSSVLVQMLPILSALGLGLARVMVSAVFGPAQVVGRFTLMVYRRDLSPLALAVISRCLSTHLNRPFCRHCAVHGRSRRVRRPLRPLQRPLQHRRWHPAARALRPRGVRGVAGEGHVHTADR